MSLFIMLPLRAACSACCRAATLPFCWQPACKRGCQGTQFPVQNHTQNIARTPQVCTYTAYGMTGLRLEPAAVLINGVASVLLYLIAAQLHSLASIVMPNEDTSFLVTSE